MIASEVREQLRRKYSYLHPLLFHRSLERSSTGGDLFDILSTVPPLYPLVWDESSRRWSRCDDMTLSDRFDFSVIK